VRLAVQGGLPSDRAEHGPLLAGIVVNAARNRRRRHYLARRHEGVDDLAPGDEDLSPEAQVAHAEECVRLRACINRLCGMQRSVVLMRLLEERPGEDVAIALGVTRSYVDVMLHRAKASLSVCMGAREEEGG
jgi:RNA polymerase sigma-70 factor, ECF subfamily